MEQNIKTQLLTKKPIELLFQLSIPAVIGMTLHPHQQTVGISIHPCSYRNDSNWSLSINGRSFCRKYYRANSNDGLRCCYYIDHI